MTTRNEQRIGSTAPISTRLVTFMTALGFAVSTLAASFTPVFAPSALAQTITDPTADIEFRPRVTSSANGTPTVDIVTPGEGGISHNKYREYNVETRGLILNNSGAGGTSVLGGAVAANPNLSGGRSARVILNEVTGTNRSLLNGMTEVFGAKADVIVANPNGVGCVGCGFINTGNVTLSSGVPDVDAKAGTVSWQTRTGDVTISGDGVSAPAGQLLGDVNLIGRTVSIGGTVKAGGDARIIAGATAYDEASGQIRVLSGTTPVAGTEAIVSSPAGVIAARSIAILSSDIDMGVVLSGDLQANGPGAAGHLSIRSAGNLKIVSAQATGNLDLVAARRLEISRDLVANGAIAIIAEDASLLATTGIAAGGALSIVTSRDMVSAAVLKAGDALHAAAGRNASFTGMLASHKSIDLEAASRVAVAGTVLQAPDIHLDGAAVDLVDSWLIASRTADLTGTDVTLGANVLFETAALSATASDTLTIGSTISDLDYQQLNLSFKNLAVTASGAIDRADLDLATGSSITNAGILRGRNRLSLAVAGLTNTATGTIAAGTAISLDLSGNLHNLGRIVSAGTLALLKATLVTNEGLIQSGGKLELKANVLQNLGVNAEIAAGNALAIEASDHLDNVLGRIFARGPAILRTSGTLINMSGTIETVGDLEISALSLVNTALAGTDGGTQVFEDLGDLNIGYATQRTSGPARYWGTMTATRDEYSGLLDLDIPGTIRAGGNLAIEGKSLENLDGRILAAGDLSIDMDRVLNDAVQYTVDHYRLEWGGDRLFMDDGSGKFHAPVGTGVGWLALPFSASVFKNASLAAVAQDGERMIVISSGKSPVTISYAGNPDHETGVIASGQVEIVEYADIASLVDLNALGIDPADIPDVIMIGNRLAHLNSAPYGNYRKTLVGQSTTLVGSLIKAKGDLLLAVDATTNRGTLAGALVSIEGGTLDNGASGDFVLDDVSVPRLDFGPIGDLQTWSLDPNDFEKLKAYTGSLEAADLLRGASITGSGLRFFADPVAEAAAFADAMRKASGRSMTLEGLSDEEARLVLYRNAQAFAEATGARYGVGLSEAQRAMLTQPLVWHETRIVNGQSVLVPVLYLPSADELLRGGRGAGLVSAKDLLIDLDGLLNNRGTLAADNLASIAAGQVVNERNANGQSLLRADGAGSGAFGRADTGLISAGTLLMTVDGDLVNRGGTIATAGSMDLQVGGSLLNETARITRTVDFIDGCIGKGCGTTRTDWNVAQIVSGDDLTIVAGGNLTNKGGAIGAVTDALLAAAGDVTFETLQDTYLLKDYKQRGFLSGFAVVEHAITTQEASAEALFGDMTILAGYSLCDGGGLCRNKGPDGSDAILNGALISAYGDLAIQASGDIDMGTVSAEVVNRYKKWGFQGLGWGKVKQVWNEIDTRGTRLSANNVTLSAGGSIDGVGVKISAATDLMMLADGDIRLAAAQDAHWFTEKGCYIGLSFPGSGAVEAALRGGSGGDILTGLADLTPLTRSLAKLAHADNGLAAGLAALNLVTTGLGAFHDAGQSTRGPLLTTPIGRMVDPFGKFRDSVTGQITPKSVASTIGITFSSWKKEQHWSESMASELVAGGDIVMRAGIDAVLNQGTRLIAGGDVSIDAERDIKMAALVDYARDKSSSFGLSLSADSLGFNIGKSKGYDERLSNAQIAASGDVRLTSGRDTVIAGGNVSGATVTIDAGRDLAILSPQAQGWRDGFSFGLTIGLSPASFSVSGSVEDGTKAWSSGSSIIARDSLDITVGEDTVFHGALLQATDGDIRLDTGTLTVSDNHDTDQYLNVGGSLGVKGKGLDTAGFSYENRDKQGQTRTTLDAAGDLNVTIHDADKDGVKDTAADKAAAEQLLAAINKDAATWQEITRDEYTKLSGDVDVEALRNLRRNLNFARRYKQAMDAPVADWIVAKGPQAIDQYREAMLYGGATPAEAEELMRTPRYQAMLRERNSFDALKQGVVGNEDLLKSVLLIQRGEELYRDPSNGALMVRTVCGTNGPCGKSVSELSKITKEDIETYIRPRLEAAGYAGLREALECAIAVAYVLDDPSYLEELETSGRYDAAQIATYSRVVEKIKNQGGLRKILPGAANSDIDVFMSLTQTVVDLESGAAAADVAAIALIQQILAQNGTVNSIVAASVVEAFEAMGFTKTAAATRTLFEAAWDEYESALKRAEAYPNSAEAKALRSGILLELIVSAMTSGRSGLVKVKGAKGLTVGRQLLDEGVDLIDLRMRKGVNKITRTYPDGTFTISDWSGYPAGVPKPLEGNTYRLLSGSEYTEARRLANAANAQLRRNGVVPAGYEVHEIIPVKYGGSPTDLANKVFLPRGEHRAELTPWWNRLQKDLGR
ncbi:two-partner secretion domain-containing protein [Pararhizobium sp.]|uniref:two-partner secretion domain-containing protein n=1 Tax=Pararhizobium sp. TaxID=1977563 RepID=UPI002723E812|nr:hemagglutinin repeat-containing protein [Pararhizobium sp.]MDO9415820.1 hemagglutinin repeat-containing protein [Pararhizobium sp.]